MRSILKSCYKFLPLLIGVVSLLLLGLALVPGRLEYASHGIRFLLVLGLKVPEWLLVGINVAGILTLILLTVYDLRKILYSRKNNLNPPPIPGLTSLFIIACTWLLIQIHLPARLCFFTARDRIEQELAQQQTKKEPIYLYTMTDEVNGRRGRFSPDDYGFAYLPDDRGTDWMEITHIYGKWYIFHENTSTGG
jgi:hypothetical protein